MKYILFLSLIILGPNCSANTNQSSVAIPTPVVTDTQYCDLAQSHLIALKCDEGNPTKKGKSFSTVCRETQDNGIFINPKCLSEVTTCDQIDSCTHSK